MKDFQDFINQLDSETFETIQTKAIKAMETCNKYREEDKTLFMSIELLHMYHNWINEN